MFAPIDSRGGLGRPHDRAGSTYAHDRDGRASPTYASGLFGGRDMACTVH